jgi:hypothetical protein
MSSPGKRRWFQIRLQTIMILIVLASLPLAKLGMRLNSIRRQQPAIVAAERARGAVWIVGDPSPKPAPASLPGRTIYDSQRREAGALEQVVEDARYGEVVCIAFASAMQRDQMGSWNGTSVNIDGQNVATQSKGEWVLHGDTRGNWRDLQQQRPPPRFDWAMFQRLPYLQILDLGDRPITDNDLEQITRATNLRALLGRRAQITDAGLAFVGRLKDLKILSLEGTAVTDDGLRSLADLRRLEVLELDRSAIRGSGLQHLAGLSQLKLLSLRHTPLADDGLEHLAGLAELRRIYFFRTDVTDAGLAKLRPLKNLDLFHLGETRVTFGGANEFEKNLPRSLIIR